MAQGVARKVKGPSPVLFHGFSNGGKLIFIWNDIDHFYFLHLCLIQDPHLIIYCCNRFMEVTSVIFLLPRTMRLQRAGCFICASILQASSSTARPIQSFQRLQSFWLSLFHQIPQFSSVSSYFSFFTLSILRFHFGQLRTHFPFRYCFEIEFVIWSFLRKVILYKVQLQHSFNYLISRDPNSLYFYHMLREQRWLFARGIPELYIFSDKDILLKTSFSDWMGKFVAHRRAIASNQVPFDKCFMLICSHVQFCTPHTSIVLLTLYHDAAAFSRRKCSRGSAPLRHRRARLVVDRAPRGLRAPLCRVPLALRTAARGARPVGGTRQHFSRSGKLEDFILNRKTVELNQF